MGKYCIVPGVCPCVFPGPSHPVGLAEIKAASRPPPGRKEGTHDESNKLPLAKSGKLTLETAARRRTLAAAHHHHHLSFRAQL